MNREILELEPCQVWTHFYNISQIPRKSGKEEVARHYIKTFAEGLGFETIVDKTGNLLVRKPAVPGMETREIICLQSHLDMITQKSNDAIHDFDEDPLQIMIDGDWVTADRTTLGADNGIGVAASMAVLESKTIPHGPLEFLFTVGEESGFIGALGLKPGFLKSKVLINLDAELEGHLYNGSAGGRSTNAILKYTEENPLPNSAAYEIRLTGLRGGHSGVDIHMEWGNAIKLMNRFLCQATKSWNVRVASIEGGSVVTAIPGEAFAIVTVPGEKLTSFFRGVREFEETLKEELSISEPSVVFEAVAVDMPRGIIDKFTIDSLIHAICECPHGVVRMNSDQEGLVHTSSNLGKITTGSGRIEIFTFQRSFDDHEMNEVGTRIRRIFKWAGASKVTHKLIFQGWKPDKTSPLLKKVESIYKELFRLEPKVKSIHAGLECGVIKSIYPDMEMVSIGPTICFAHSPNERVNIVSVRDFWMFLVEILKGV